MLQRSVLCFVAIPSVMPLSLTKNLMVLPLIASWAQFIVTKTSIQSKEIFGFLKEYVSMPAVPVAQTY